MEIEYDPRRGGFCVSFRPRADRTGRGVKICEDIQAYMSADSRIAAVESFFDSNGGLPLESFRAMKPAPSGDYSFDRDGLAIDGLLIRQSNDNLDLWFNVAGPLEIAPTRHNADLGVSVWLGDLEPEADRRMPTSNASFTVRGLRFRFARLAAEYPLTSLSLNPADFK